MMGREIVVPNSVAGVALVALALLPDAAQASNFRDDDFKLGGGKYPESTGPTIGGMPAWALAMVATIAACIVFLVAFCCIRMLIRKMKGTSHRGRRNSFSARTPSPAGGSGPSPGGFGDSVQCHLCLGKVGRKKWENGLHRRKCAEKNRGVLERLPIPYDVCCARCGALLRQWPRRGPPFRCGGGRGCPAAMGGRPLAVDNNGANRFACFECGYDLCRACVQKRVRRRSEAAVARGAQAAAQGRKRTTRDPDLLQVREPSLRRLKLEYSDVSETSPDHLQPQSPHQPDVVSNESSSSPRILVTAPTNQDLLDQVMLQKRRQHQVVGAAGAAAAASRASTVVAMTPSLIMRAEPTTSPPTEQVSPSQEQRQVSVSGGSSRTTSEHPSLMSSELSSQLSSAPTSPTPMLPTPDVPSTNQQ